MRPRHDSHRPAAPASPPADEPPRRKRDRCARSLFPLYVVIALGFWASVRLRAPRRGALLVAQSEAVREPRVPTGDAGDMRRARAAGCLVTLDELTEAERRPTKGARHMVDPPVSPITLVCCRTTKGPLSIAARPRWAPRGARRFIDMVQANYFSTRVPLFRCVKNFICQFGISGTPSKIFRKSFRDDPSWLPFGPRHWSVDGVARFATGYLAYAGGGANSRGNQFILGLGPNERLCGGSPWEVPWGELVGATSFETLSNIYTGYGEKGPTQGYLHAHGADGLEAQFSLLDFVEACDVVDDGTAAGDWAPYDSDFVHTTFRAS